MGPDDGRALQHTNGVSPILQTKLALQRARLEVTDSARKLRDDVRGLADWRRPIRRKPWLFVGAALAVGLLLGLTRRPRRGAPR